MIAFMAGFGSVGLPSPAKSAGPQRMAVVEGPASDKLPGWSHFWLHVGTRKPAAFLAESNGAARRAVLLGAEFFPRGTWEAADRKAALLAWLRGGALKV